MAGRQFFNAKLFQSSRGNIFLGAIAGCSTAKFAFQQFQQQQQETSDDKESSTKKYFTRKQVSENDGTNGKPTFVTFHGSVYDVSEFKKEHPGGNFINQAAGSDIEPFWNKWRYHYHTKKVKETLEGLKVGYLVEPDVVIQEGAIIDNVTSTKEGLYKEEFYKKEEDMYLTDPIRTNEHLVLIQKPFTSETRPEVLKLSYLTPTSALYIRNHAPVPNDLDANDHEIIFSNSKDSVVDTISIKDMMQKYDEVNIVSVLQCAGNRAAEDIKATGKTGFVGTPYEFIQSGMVGNVLWSGVKMSSVLKEMYPKECASVDDDGDSEWHVIFQGADEYETSTPLKHLLKDENNCLLATKMNGVPLSLDHGYPIRAVLPGIAGARNVKWLESIQLSKLPSSSPWNDYYYKKADESQIQELPMNSMILSPKNNETVSVNGSICIQGIAYSGGSGNRITDVEVSIDQGKSWSKATLKSNEIIENDTNTTSSYGWVRFEASVNVDGKNDEKGDLVLMCRATDQEGTTQPKVSTKQRGYLYNGYNQININTSSK